VALSDAEQQQVQKNFPWNFSVNLLDIIFYMFALNLVGRQTLLPLLVSQLTDSKLAIGLIPALDSMGFLLPQLLAANYAEGLRRKLPFIVPIAFLERLPYLLISIVVWQFAKPAPELTVVAILVLLAIHTTSGGITMPAWYDLIAKVIPARRRGVWSGLGHGLGALLGVAGAALAGRILVEWAFPDNFAICFLLAFVAIMISYVGLILNREPDSPTVKTGTRLIGYLKQLPTVLRRDKNYLRFLLSRAVMGLGGMAAGFYAVYGNERWGLGGEGIALMTAILTGSQAVMGVVWGVIGDRRGHKVVLCAGACAAALAALAALVGTEPLWLWLAFALLGANLAASNASGMVIILEFCAPDDRPTYIGLTNSLLAPVSIVAPLIGGLLATLAGYQGLFGAAIIFAALGALLMAAWVRDPRQPSRSGIPA
jgi:MFS family permease